MTKTTKGKWEQAAPLVRLRVEDSDALKKLGKRRLLTDVLHEVIEAGVASITKDLPGELAKLQADRLLVANFLKARGLLSVKDDLEKEGLL